MTQSATRNADEVLTNLFLCYFRRVQHFAPTLSISHFFDNGRIRYFSEHCASVSIHRPGGHFFPDTAVLHHNKNCFQHQMQFKQERSTKCADTPRARKKQKKTRKTCPLMKKNRTGTRPQLVPAGHSGHPRTQQAPGHGGHQPIGPFLAAHDNDVTT